MSDKVHILAVDIGTSATKAVLFNPALEVVSAARRPHQIYHPRRGWSEQDPEEIVEAVIQAIRQIVQGLPARHKPLTLTFSSQQYSILAVDSNGSPLTKSLTWADTRSSDVAERLRKQPEAREIYTRTGCPLDAIYPLSKIGWLRERNDFEAGVRFISIKEYVIFHITNQYIVDWSTASASGLFDIQKHQWDQAALDLLGIRSTDLSRLVSPRTVLPEPGKEFLAATGLPAGTQIVVGGGDGPLANLGVGATRPDILAINAGTSAAARCAVTKALIDPQGRLWTYVVAEGLWVIGGIVSSGGQVFRWWVENTAQFEKGSNSDMETADREAASTPPGADGLLFIPYLGGEQCPTWHPQTRGGFFGLDFRHQRGHMSRAILEGIARSLYRVAEQIQNVLGQPFSEIRVSGGLTQSPVWLQIAADMFGVPVIVPKSAEGSARGAAILAGLALGLWSTPDQVGGILDIERVIAPRPEVHQFYNSQYGLFLSALDCYRQTTESILNKTQA
jgi:gluconokinase